MITESENRQCTEHAREWGALGSRVLRTAMVASVLELIQRGAQGSEALRMDDFPEAQEN